MTGQITVDDPAVLFEEFAGNASYGGGGGNSERGLHVGRYPRCYSS
jgi:hypothetical protein